MPSYQKRIADMKTNAEHERTELLLALEARMSEIKDRCRTNDEFLRRRSIARLVSLCAIYKQHGFVAYIPYPPYA